MENIAIIFGGSGFIGGHLVRQFRDSFVKEIIVADVVPPPKNEMFKGSRYVYCDVQHLINRNLISKPALVVNLAAVHRTPGHSDQEYFDTNVSGAMNIVRFCEDTGSNRLWFTSSIAVYGPSEDPKSENSKPTPKSAYGQSKLEAEDIQKEWFNRCKDRKLLIVRPAVIFGAGENGNFSKLAKALKMGIFVYPGRKDTIKGCGYVGDLIGSMFFMDAQEDDFILYNYCYPEAYSIQDICETFCQVAGYRRPLGTLPLTLMVRVAQFFKGLDSLGVRNPIHPAKMHKLTESTHIIPGELIRRGYPFRTNLESGLRQWEEDIPSGQFV